MTPKSTLLTRQPEDSFHEAMIVDLHRTLSARSSQQSISDDRPAHSRATYTREGSDHDVDDIIAIISEASSSIKELEGIISHRESIINQQNKIIDQLRLIEKETANRLTTKEEECVTERERADRVEGLLISYEKQVRNLEEESATLQTNLSKLTRAIRDSLRPAGAHSPDAVMSLQSAKAAVKTQTIAARRDSRRVDAMAL